MAIPSINYSDPGAQVGGPLGAVGPRSDSAPPIDPVETYRRLQAGKHHRGHPAITTVVVLVVLSCGAALAYFVTTARAPAPIQAASVESAAAPATPQPIGASATPPAATPASPKAEELATAAAPRTQDLSEAAKAKPRHEARAQAHQAADPAGAADRSPGASTEVGVTPSPFSSAPPAATTGPPASGQPVNPPSGQPVNPPQSSIAPSPLATSPPSATASTPSPGGLAPPPASNAPQD